MPKNYICKKEYNFIAFEKQEKIENYKYILEDKILLPNEMLIEKVSDSVDSSNYTLKLNSKDIKLPLVVRNALDNDKIHIKGMKEEKKVSSVYKNEKLTTKQRKLQPIVVDSNDTILWLPGLKKSVFDKAKTTEYDIILRYCEKREEK